MSASMLIQRIDSLVVAVSLVAAIGPCSLAEAQFTSSLGGNFNNAGSALLGTMIANRLLVDAARKGAEPGPPARQPASASHVTFQPAAANHMVKELAGTLAPDPANRRQLEQAFEEYLQNFAQQASRDHEPANDVGRAAAYFVMVNYFAATGQEPTDDQADGAQAIFRAGLALSPGFTRMGNRDRQRLYESLVVLGSLPLAGVVDATQAKDAAREKMFRGFARELLETLLGVPVEKIRLTKTGFSVGG